MGQFLRGPNKRGGGGYVAAYVPPDWDGALKKQQLTRRGGRQHGGGARGKDGGGGGGGGGGNICEATTLWKGSAACPPVCKAASCTTHTQMCTWVARHTQECQHINMQTRVHEDRFIK